MQSLNTKHRNHFNQPTAEKGQIMTNEDSNMAANAICFAADMVKQEWLYTLGCYQRPSVIYKPELSVDGNMYCVSLGQDLQNGIAGFGETPAKAYEDFDKNFTTSKLPIKPEGK